MQSNGEETGLVLTVIHKIPADLAWLNFSQASLLWTSAFAQTWASAKTQTFLSPLTAYSESQLTIREKQFLLNCPIMLYALQSPYWTHHTHTHTHTHTQSSYWPYTSFHVKEISFSFLFWDMSGSMLKTLSQLQSVPFKGSVNSDSLRPYCLQHIWLHCPSPTPRACLKFRPIKMVCNPTISSFFVPFSSGLQYFPASGTFPMSLSLPQMAKVLELQH